MPDLFNLFMNFEAMNGRNITISKVERNDLVLEECKVTYKNFILNITGTDEEGETQEFILELNDNIKDFEIYNFDEIRVDFSCIDGDIIIETW